MLPSLLHWIPELLVWPVAGLLALMFMRRCGLASVLVLLASLGGFVLQAIGIAILYAQFEGMMDHDVLTGLSLVRTLAYTVCIVMVVAAVFVGRKAPQPLPAQSQGS